MSALTAKERITALITAIKTSNEPNKEDDLRSVEELINDCGRYIEKVTAMEAAIAATKFRMEPEEWREHIMTLDRNRKLAHDSLIVSVRVINRFCRLYEVERVYDGPEERIPIAEFAMVVTQDFFNERKL